MIHTSLQLVLTAKTHCYGYKNVQTLRVVTHKFKNIFLT